MTSLKITTFTMLALVLGALGMSPDVSANRIKCWNNNEGVRECGNVVPPEYAQKRHTEKTKGGWTKSVTERAKTKEEIAQAVEDKARREKEAKEQARLAAVQAEKDSVLLRTYSTEDDLVMARDGKLAALDSRIKHTESITRNLETKLVKLQQKAAQQERGGQKIDTATFEEIGRVKRQIRDNEAFVQARNNEKVEINASFEADLSRWQELRSM